jgi:hypothetical protein
MGRDGRTQTIGSAHDSRFDHHQRCAPPRSNDRAWIRSSGVPSLLPGHRTWPPDHVSGVHLSRSKPPTTRRLMWSSRKGARSSGAARQSCQSAREFTQRSVRPPAVPAAPRRVWRRPVPCRADRRREPPNLHPVSRARARSVAGSLAPGVLRGPLRARSSTDFFEPVISNDARVISELPGDNIPLGMVPPAIRCRSGDSDPVNI